MAAYSISRLGVYKTCPLQYKYNYIDGIKVEVEKTVEAFLGQVIHEVLEKLYRDRQHEKILSLAEMIAFFNKIWQQNWSDKILIVKKEYGPENYRRMGERYLADYYNRYKPFDEGRIIGLETREFLRLDEEGKFLFHIRIDRLIQRGGGVYEIHDYKAGSSLPTQEDLDKDEQLALYSLWVRKRFKDCTKVRLVWHLLAFDKEMDSYRTEEELEALRRRTLARIKEVEAALEFPAKVSSLCDWCVYKPICPAWKHSVEVAALPENEFLNDPGVKLVDEYVRTKNEFEDNKIKAETKLEKLKEAIIAFCQKEGVSVVFGSDNKITVREQENYKFPAKNTPQRREFAEALKRLGKWEEASDLDFFTLTRVLKNKEWDQASLDVVKRFLEGIERTYRLSVSKK